MMDSAIFIPIFFILWWSMFICIYCKKRGFRCSNMFEGSYFGGGGGGGSGDTGGGGDGGGGGGGDGGGGGA